MAAKRYRAVMLIDDNEIDNLINQKMIEAANLAEHIYIHTTAKGALEFLKNTEKLPLDNQVLPDIVFLDIDMPLMDGFQFLDLFNQLKEETKKKCKIVILTSSINPQDISKSKNYGFVKKYLNKPLTQQSLSGLTI